MVLKQLESEINAETVVVKLLELEISAETVAKSIYC